jgi:hypothetical protein
MSPSMDQGKVDRAGTAKREVIRWVIFDFQGIPWFYFASSRKGAIRLFLADTDGEQPGIDSPFSSSPFSKLETDLWRKYRRRGYEVAKIKIVRL